MLTLFVEVDVITKGREGEGEGRERLSEGRRKGEEEGRRRQRWNVKR